MRRRGHRLADDEMAESPPNRKMWGENVKAKLIGC